MERPWAEAGGAWGTHLGSASPCRFWASVEPYCADITSEEVRTLEELLKPPEDEAEHYKVETLSLNRHGREQEGSEVPQNQSSQNHISSSFPYPAQSSVYPFNPPRNPVSAFSLHCLPSVPFMWLPHPKASTSVRLSLVPTSLSPQLWFKTSISFHPNRLLILPSSRRSFLSLIFKSLFF